MSPHRQPPGASTAVTELVELVELAARAGSAGLVACASGEVVECAELAMASSWVDARDLAEEQLIDRLAERLIADRLALRVRRLGVLAGDVAQPILAVGGSLEHDLGDLLGGRVA